MSRFTAFVFVALASFSLALHAQAEDVADQMGVRARRDADLLLGSALDSTTLAKAGGATSEGKVAAAGKKAAPPKSTPQKMGPQTARQPTKGGGSILSPEKWNPRELLKNLGAQGGGDNLQPFAPLRAFAFATERKPQLRFPAGKGFGAVSVQSRNWQSVRSPLVR
eukprot:gnl/TRDRNA2_/TRDRNA2_168693_c0_seq1.p1 gnl/TRDRNA2_/TRDRNA2_168693_c0~~gnl/TRDRNA2_/TRDRNA2_168693_c0_seq1.p1  ORF type:complete len:166 (+),score=14.90 gnl/TRDRNA2_/TRDRNA2_168693_c0_seq1:92-589(+)